MSALGSANSSAHGAAPLSTSPSDPENDTSVERRMIVHPRFFRQLKEEPAVFCPLDWLPDEVISNVLVHLVSAPSREPRTRADVATSPRTPHPPNPPPPPRAPRRRRQSGPPHRVPHERSPQPEPRPADEPSSHDPPRPLAARPRRRALQHRQPQGPQAVRGRRRVEGALRQALRHSPREPRQARVRVEHPVPDPPQRALLAVQGRREAIARAGHERRLRARHRRHRAGPRGRDVHLPRRRVRRRCVTFVPKMKPVYQRSTDAACGRLLV